MSSPNLIREMQDTIKTSENNPDIILIGTESYISLMQGADRSSNPGRIRGGESVMLLGMPVYVTESIKGVIVMDTTADCWPKP